MKRKVALLTAAALLLGMTPLAGCSRGNYDFEEVVKDWSDVEVSSQGGVNIKAERVTATGDSVADKFGY